MLDCGSSLNIISLFVLDLVGVPWENITRRPIEVTGFGGDRTHTLGFVNLDLTVKPIRVAHRFHAIDAQMTYRLSLQNYSMQLMLGRPWIHRYKTILSTYHQFLKAIWKDRRVHINAIESQF